MLPLELYNADTDNPCKDLLDRFLNIADEEFSGKHNPLSFATHETLEKIKNNIKDIVEGKKPEDILDIWEFLLQDSLLYLKINDVREKAFKSLEDLDKLRRENGYKKVFRENHVYGLNELIEYIRDFKNFEGILYGADDFYRDHLIHPINVWITGIIILNSYGKKFSLITSGGETIQIRSRPHYLYPVPKPACLKCQHCEDVNSTVDSVQPFFKKAGAHNIEKRCEAPCFAISLGELGAMWTIIALSHDLGYPLGMIGKISTAIDKMLAHFAKGGTSKTDFSFQSQHIQLIRTLNRIVSGKIERIQIAPYRQGEAPQQQKIWRARVRSKYFSKFANAWQQLEHGILSSYVLLRKLTYFMEADYAVDESLNLDPEDARQLVIRSEILLAIASHTNNKIYHLNPWTLSFLLIICDELQEWGRPSFNELGMDVKGILEKIELKVDKFKSANNRENADQIKLVFTYDKQAGADFLTKRFNKSRPQWNERLRPGVDDSNRKIYFQLTMILDDNMSQYSIDSSGEVYDQVTVLECQPVIHD